jgi:hypothetical protein
MALKSRVALVGLVILTSVKVLWAQKPIAIRPDKPIICYQSHIDEHLYLSPPENFLQMRKNPSARVKTANFEVEYINFPADAQTAFEFAVGIWETQLKSSVTIKVKAEWGNLGSGVLGQAIWGSAFANFDNAPNINTFYPVALAEKIAGKELNPSTDEDIHATFNSAATWHFKTDGAAPSGKTDLVTVVLHELAHGLGVTDTYDVDGANGSVGMETGGNFVPFAFDLFVENGANKNLFAEVVSPSANMKTQLTSNSVFFDGTATKAANSGIPAKLYAPSTFDQGSSISHLDESTFNGTPNALMTPQIGTAEAIHDPGSIVLGILNDLGWVFTRIVHTPLKDTERQDGAVYAVNTTIVSDNGYNPSTVTLHYTDDGTNFTTVTMTSVGPDQYTANIPGTTLSKTYGYYISVQDNTGKTFNNPGKTQASDTQPTQSLNYFTIGPDTQAPVIAHEPVEYVFEGDDAISISATVTDNLGVGQVKIDYIIKEVPQGSITMTAGPGDNEYVATIPLPPGLVIDDKIEYRIVAKDLSDAGNVNQSPESDYYVIYVTGLKPVQNSYSNDFDSTTTDFIGNSFNVATPNGFDNGAIHSHHPYDNGSGANSESNYIYQLQIPIRINSSNPYIQFNEIALVEPGESGSVFGDDNFFDYVIVEGSSDLGETWHPFVDGYDARNNSAWLTKWDSGISGDNSDAVGDKTLFKTRLINMLQSGDFAAGDEVIIRFRLFADAAAYGWGWAIDDLLIQDNAITGVEEVSSSHLSVYPNPVKDKLSIESDGLIENTSLTIMSAQGQIMHRQFIHGFAADIDVSSFSEGLYIIQFQSGEKRSAQKFLKVR